MDGRIMFAVILSSISLICAAVPAWLFLRNLRAYRPAPQPHDHGSPPEISILIPARDEAAVIGNAVRAALASQSVHCEVLVLDDGSKDETAAIVRELAAHDGRVSLVVAPPWTPGWCGKQRACAALAERASYDRLLFLDADVVVTPDAAARAVAFLETSRAALVSGIPRQTTGTWGERLLIPLIHFVLLGFLPFRRMRRSTHPSYSAGCGQFLLTTKAAYRQAGGHAAIRQSLHDGVMLPRAYRSVGLMTDVFDATDLATCRMYRSASEVWSGLQKNAIEGLAAPRLIVPITAVLLLGQVAPYVMLVASGVGLVSGFATTIALLAALFAWLPRMVAVVRFRQSWLGAIVHPVGVLALLAVQWSAFGRWLVGSPVSWKGRGYSHRSMPIRDAVRLSAYDVKTSI